MGYCPSQGADDEFVANENAIAKEIAWWQDNEHRIEYMVSAIVMSPNLKNLVNIPTSYSGKREDAIANVLVNAAAAIILNIRKRSESPY